MTNLAQARRRLRDELQATGLCDRLEPGVSPEGDALADGSARAPSFALAAPAYIRLQPTPDCGELLAQLGGYA